MERMRNIFIGILIGCVLMATPALADGVFTQINVVLDGTNVQLEGENVDAHSILYNGTTYLPIRKVAELVGKDINWNNNTNTINIIEKGAGDIVNENNLTQDDKIIETKSGVQYDVIIDGVEYYSCYYVTKEVLEAKGYSLYYDDTEGKFRLSKFSGLNQQDEEIIIESVPCIRISSGGYVSKDYYENTILPLIK